jgi:hypothetical protein
LYGIALFNATGSDTPDPALFAVSPASPSAAIATNKNAARTPGSI